jgi:predicted TIM-barrel fold metal-dependent hydrolase
MEFAQHLPEAFSQFTDNKGRQFVRNPRGSAKPWGKIYYDIEQRLSALTDAGFDRQVLLAEQGFVPDYVGLETSIEICRRYNDAVARIQREHEEFIACAEIPHRSAEAAISEVKRAVNELGLKGVRIFGTWSGRNIESEDWWPFFEVVNELDVPLMLHSVTHAGGGDLGPNLVGREVLQAMSIIRGPTGKQNWLSMPSILAFTWEAMCVIAGLVLHGVLKKYPNLRIGVLESGSATLALYMANRLDFINETEGTWRSAGVPGPYSTESGFPITVPPSEYVKKHFWFAVDNVGEAEMSLLIRELGLGPRLMAQTDFPHAEGTLDVVRWFKEMNISESDKEFILGKNAAQLFKLK